MDIPRENDPLIWTKEAQTFQSILNDVKKATNKSHRKFLQTIHARDIVTRTQDLVTTIQLKLSCERERRIAHRNDGISLLKVYYLERRSILRSQRHSRDAQPEKMYDLSQKMMEQHKRLVSNERKINEVENMEEMARIAMKNLSYRAKHSFKSKKNLPRVLLKSRPCHTCTRGREQKFNEGVLPNLYFQRIFADDWEIGTWHLLPLLGVSNSKNSLQLACKESHEVVQERYTFVFQPMSDGKVAQDPENVTALNLLPFNPDIDIVHTYLWLEERDTWEHELSGLTPVKHLSLDGEYLYDIDAIERIEAACPNLEILTIRVEGNDFFRDLVGYDPRVDLECIEMNSSFLDNLAARISNEMCSWKSQRIRALRDKYNRHTELFDRTKGGNSEYWKRVNMRVVLLQKPVCSWPRRHRMY
ncbi:hypothetical protein BELL_0412g00010 [Botrytis elliptica]|uniref:Uncharacterized protein n=1 Tax=Botrytis elliptica TaxID=278938 RepID=A0A4Z1JMU4_9HELO|nr:hypothetical protein BELL_0412g00010 [Botrytis elliptica]